RRSLELQHRIPVVEPVEFAPRDNPPLLPPYLMGFLLAGVGLRGREREAETVSVDGVATRLRRRAPSALALQYYGLDGGETFVPDDYAYASVSERLDLLRGLFDSDPNATVPGAGTVDYVAASPR